MRVHTLYLPTSLVWAIVLSMVTSSRGLSASTTTTTSAVVSELCLHPAAKNIVVPPENIAAIQGLEPRALWSQFAILSSIPRPSKQEGAVLQYIKDFAEHYSLRWKQDAVGNLVVFHPGTTTKSDDDANNMVVPAIILQGHVDMVTEKNSDKQHNFETDPILFRRFTKRAKISSSNGEEQQQEKHWLGAQGTTLGADNGIGVAAALALLQTPTDESTSTRTRPPLEALFTIDEETGLTGATNLDAKALGLTGKTMLNLDTEEWGELYVGCAGGGESTITLSLERQGHEGDIPDCSVKKLVQIKVEGFMGGHSGINIHEGRANAVLLCAAATRAALLAAHGGVHLVSITGGDKHNAIPREARAFLLLCGGEHVMLDVERVVENFQNAVLAEYGGLEQNARISLLVEKEKEDYPRPLTTESANRLLSVLLSLPHGPVKFSHAMPDLVETSNNVASLTMSNMEAEGDDDTITTATILCSTRSSISSALEATRDRLAAVAFLAGASIERSPAYPGWNPNMESPVLHLAKKLLAQRLLGGNESHHHHHHHHRAQPGVKAIHAGLECGLLIEKLGGNVDALSFGPTIVGAHSPDESILTDTVPPFFTLVQDILSELAKKRSLSS